MWVSLPPKAATQKFPEAASPGGRRLAVLPRRLKREQSGWPVQIHSAQVRFYPEPIYMEVFPCIVIKRAPIPPGLR